MTQHNLDLKIAAAGIALINSLGKPGRLLRPATLGYFEAGHRPAPPVGCTGCPRHRWSPRVTVVLVRTRRAGTASQTGDAARAHPVTIHGLARRHPHRR